MESIDDLSRSVQGGIAKAFLNSRVSHCGRPESARRARTRQIRPIEKLNIEIYSRQNMRAYLNYHLLLNYALRDMRRDFRCTFHSVVTLIDHWLKSLHLRYTTIFYGSRLYENISPLCMCVCEASSLWKEIRKIFLMKECRKIFLTSFVWSDLYDIAIQLTCHLTQLVKWSQQTPKELICFS